MANVRGHVGLPTVYFGFSFGSFGLWEEVSELLEGISVCSDRAQRALTVTAGEETIEMSTLKNKEDQEYSKDLFGGYYRKNFDVFKAPEEQAPQRFNFKVRQLGAGDRSTDDINSGNTSLTYSPSRRTPTHKQALDLNFDSANPSLAVINQKTTVASQQQNQQPLWFNNPKRRTNPSHAIKREVFDELEPESNFLTKTKSNQGSGPGFRSLTFGTRRDNTEMSHVNAFSDELPPSKTISDLQREDKSDSYLSVNPTNANTSIISQKPIGEDSGIFGQSNGTPTFQRSRNILPDHLTKSGNSSFSTPFKQEHGISETQKTVSSPLRTDESAVLVFGYPESIANSVIKHFAKFGTILEDFEATRVDPLFHKQNNKTYPIFTGNGWIKLTYDNRASAIRALEESGTVFHGSMIGCVPYSKQAIENIASISIPTSEDIGESDIALQKNSSIQDENNLLNFTSNSQKISLKNDDKIFVKPKNEKTNLYSSRSSKETKQTNNSMLNKVNNWLFGWEDL